MKTPLISIINLLIIAFILTTSICYSQEKKETKLDSIYALQAVHYKAKDYSKVIDLSTYAKTINLKNAQDSLTFARITAYIGYANNKYNNFYKSIAGFEEALNYIPSTKDKGTINTNYAILYDLLTRYYSLRRYKKALSVALKAEELIDNYDYIRASRHTWLYQRKFRMYSALGFYDKAALEVEKIKQKLVPITSETDEAMRYGWMRYYRSSLLLSYNEFLYTKEENLNYLDKISPLKDNVLVNMAKLDSIVENTKSLQKPEKRSQFSNLSLYVGALYYVSDFYKELEDYDLSLQYINKAIKLSKIAKEPTRNVSEFLRFRANVINELGDTKKSLALIADLEQNFDKKNYNLDQVLVFKGDLYTENKEVDSVLHYYTEAVKLMHNSETKLDKDFKNYASRYQFPSDCKQLQHMSDMLFDFFPENEKAIKTAKNLNAIAYQEFLNNHNNFDLSRGNRQLFHNIIETMLEHNNKTLENKNSFISSLENISNRLAWQQFSQSRDIVQLPVIDSLEQVEFNIRKQLVQAKKERQLKQQDSLESELVNYRKKIEKKYPKISSFTQDNFELSKFQEQLNADEVALKYIFFQSQFVVFQITKTDVKWHLKPWKEKEQQVLDQHLKYLKNPKEQKQINAELTKILIPEESLLFNKIRIIPDQPIYYLPFETLSFNANYLVKEKTILYSSHLRFAFIESDKADNKNKTSVTIFAPNYPENATTQTTRSSSVFLEGAQEEAKVLESLFPSQAFIGETATKENFVLNKSKGDILHMAMHASVDEEDPVFSHFNFPNNEKLFLEELYALKIPANLAVLSACNTAVGIEDGSLGIGSLHRAFNYAGTSATIASLWEVPDETTSKIMISFYKHLKKGKTKSVALQQAKIEYLNETNNVRLQHPYYWAGFVLYGTDNPVVTSNYYYIIKILFVVVFIVFIIYGYILRRKKKKY